MKKKILKVKFCLIKSRIFIFLISYVEYGNVKDLILIIIDWFLCIIYYMYILCLYGVCLLLMEFFVCFSVIWLNIWLCILIIVSFFVMCVEFCLKLNFVNWNMFEIFIRICVFFCVMFVRNVLILIMCLKDMSVCMKMIWKWCWFLLMF